MACKQPFKDIDPKVISAMKTFLTQEDTYHAAHSRRMARTLEELIKNDPQGKLLEVGTSHLIPLCLSELAAEVEVTVTDFDMKKPPFGIMRCEMNGFSLPVDVVRVNIEEEELPFEDNTFDIILLCEVLEHMEVDPMFMLSEINRVLKEDGLLVLTTPNITSTRAIHKILNGIEPHFYMQYQKNRAMYRHNYEYSVGTLEKVLTAAGFQGKIWSEDCFEDPIASVPLALESIGYKPKEVGDNIFAIMNKVSGVVDRYPKEIYVD